MCEHAMCDRLRDSHVVCSGKPFDGASSRVATSVQKQLSKLTLSCEVVFEHVPPLTLCMNLLWHSIASLCGM
jgi:hypothetical protein